MDKDSSPVIKGSSQPYPGEGEEKEGSGQLPVSPVLRNGIYFQENESILVINQFVSIKVKMKLKQFFVSSSNLKRDMLPNW